MTEWSRSYIVLALISHESLQIHARIFCISTLKHASGFLVGFFYPDSVFSGFSTFFNIFNSNIYLDFLLSLNFIRIFHVFFQILKFFLFSLFWIIFLKYVVIWSVYFPFFSIYSKFASNLLQKLQNVAF